MKALTQIKNKLISWQFKPSILGPFVNPFFIARRGLYNNIKKLAPQIRGKVLDVGCGTKPYEKLFKANSYTGLDTHQSGHFHSNSKVDVFYDGKIFPFNKEEFDAVVCFQVIDDLFTPNDFLKEINRVLKNGGNLLLTVSFIWGEHEQPYDNVRYTSFGIKHILEENGFEIVELRKSVNNLSLIFQLTNAYLYRILSMNLFTKMIAFMLAIPFTLMGLLFSVILPNNNDLYLDNIVLAKKIKSFEQ